MLSKEFKYYLEHQQELLKEYEGKYIVIKNQKVIGAYDSDIDAYNNSLKDNKAGTFLIQQCLPGKENYTQSFHSRVIFT